MTTTTARKTTRKARPSAATVERRRAEREQTAAAMQAQLADRVDALAGSDEWMRYLDFSRSFHNYSLSNLMLILAQRPDASQVAGFQQWRAKGRQVRKGERAIKIYGYSSKKTTETDEATGETVERKRVFFPILSVFDIAQTDPIDGHPQPEHPARRLEGEDPTQIADRVAAVMVARGWNVTREAIPGEVNGYTTTDGSKRIVIDADLSPAQAAKTAIHEAAHALLHADADAMPEGMHRGIGEVEAESVAYVLAGLLGLDTAAYSVGYVTGWAGGDAEKVRDTAGRVLGAVRTLADALGLDDADESDSEPAA
ncbi:ImmA/IrrE family metallo-endopeptidase [Rhodococcus hoagii]|nr:ImmA/IrrE family metallo-endopeptidase [Prescottella equi]NKS71675.1 ImmA/IrrE family metallo-endopeptidase [Prescottella equi]